MAAVFDTHKFILRLREAGFEERQAEAVIAVLAESHGEWNAATRRDVGETEARISERIRELELQLKANVAERIGELEAQLKAHVAERIAEAKTDIIKWVAGMLLAQAALIAALVKLL